MLSIKPVNVNKENFKLYGEYFNLKEEQYFSGDVWDCYLTKKNIIKEDFHLGMVYCDPAPFVADSMERHVESEEIIFCGDQPTILTVANSDPNGNPKAEDVRAFIVNPGDVVVIAKGICHDANHGINGKSFYYFMTKSGGDPSETVFHQVVPNPVEVRI